MKIGLLTEVYPPFTGGSGRWLFEVYRRFQSSSVAVIAGLHPNAAEFDQQQGLDVTRLPLSFSHWGFMDRRGFTQYIATFRHVRKLVRQKGITELHCGRLIPEGWLAWMMKVSAGVPYWIYVHGEELSYGQNSRQLKWMMNRVLARATGVIANSQNTKSLLFRDWSVPEPKLHVVNPGVNAERFVPADHDDTIQEQLGWKDRRVVLTVGRLQKRKGHDMLIRALPVIRRAVPNVLYAIVGDGEERSALESLVRREGVEDCTQFLGEVDESRLIPCYQQCDVFALPNREVNGDIEGFGMVLVEAQACGKPVLAGRSGGTGETMDEPRTGIRVDCETPVQLSKALSELLSDADLRFRMGAAARTWVEERFHWPVLAGQLGQVLGLELAKPAELAICTAVSNR